MSTLDRVDLTRLAACCVRAVHARLGIGRSGDTLTCPAGHALAVDHAGRWTAAAKETSR